MEKHPYGNYGGGYGNAYGAYGGGYSQRPVSAFWSKARVQINRYYTLLGRFFWIPPLTVSLGICLAAWVVSQMPPDYISESRMLVTGQYDLPKEGGAVYNEQLDNFYGTQIALMKSLEVRKDAMARVQTLHPDMQPEALDFSKLIVNQEPHASVFNLSFEAQSSEYAQAYLEAIMYEYTEAKRKLRLQKSDDTTLAIEDELARLDKENVANDAEMQEFQKVNNIGFLEKEGNDAAVYLAQKNRELTELKSEYDLLQMLDLDQNLDRQRSLANAAGAPATTAANSDASAGAGTDPSNPGNASSTGPIADYAKAKQQLEVTEAKRAGMAQRLRPAHPDMVAIDLTIQQEKDLITALRGQSVDAIKVRRDSLQIQMQNVQSVIKSLETKALDLSGRLSEFNRIKNKTDRTKTEYERLLTSRNSVTVTKNVDQDSIMIMDHASVGVSIKPGLTRIVLAGAGAGILLGIIILFCIDQLDDRIGSFIELQTHFQETILGQIPRENFTEETALLRHQDDRLSLLEAFRSLRSSLIFFPTDGARPKTLVITSALPNEGKTTLSANLAITMAFSGARTLVVDADMRRGRLSNLFGVTEGNGLSTVLIGTIPWRETVHQTTVENLSLISCGPPLKHPSEYLLGKVLDQFLKDVYAEYDYVIFDSPPVTLLDDTLSLAPKVDGVMVVVRFGVSAVRTTRRTIELLSQRQSNIMGMICNDVQLAESEYNYGYYYRQTAEAYHKEARVAAD